MSVKTMNKVSISDLRETLVEHGYDAGELKALGKAELRKMVETIKDSSDILSNVKPETSSDLDIPHQDNEKESTLKMYDPNWTKYVMTLFEPNELENGMPRVDALRRVAHEILGLFGSTTDILQTPDMENGGRASVKVRLEFPGFNPPLVVDGCADVYSGNTAKEYAVHAVATAETRAEGRALRKALFLTKILSAEELQNADIDEPDGSDNRIVASLVTGIQVMADRLKIDPLKVAISLGHDVQTLDDLTVKQGKELVKEFGMYQRKEKEITDAVRK